MNRSRLPVFQADIVRSPPARRPFPTQTVHNEHEDDDPNINTEVGHRATTALGTGSTIDKTPGIPQVERVLQQPMLVASVGHTSKNSAHLQPTAMLQPDPSPPSPTIGDLTVRVQGFESRCEQLLAQLEQAQKEKDAQASKDQVERTELGKQLEEARSRIERTEANQELQNQQDQERLQRLEQATKEEATQASENQAGETELAKELEKARSRAEQAEANQKLKQQQHQENEQRHQELRQVHQELCRQYQELFQENKDHRRELFDLRKSVWTLARIRPRIPHDRENEKINLVSSDPSKHRCSLVLRKEHKIKRLDADQEFDFDRVFHEHDTNHTVSSYVKPMVQAAAEDGLDAAIFLEGPSGSGKSHTLFGQDDGIALSMAKYLFERPNVEGEPSSAEIHLYGFKVYNGLLYDALDCKNRHGLHISNEAPMRVYYDPHFKQRFEGKKVSSAAQLTAAFKQIYSARDEGRTKQNETSSRGHTICMLDFDRRGTAEGQSNVSLLFLVDLAGPESMAQSQNSNETRSITQSRMELRCRLRDMVKLHASSDKPKRSAREAMRYNLKNSPVCGNEDTIYLGD